MVPVITHARELRAFIILACLVIALLLLVVTPVHSQQPASPSTNAVEVVDTQLQFTAAWILTIATLILALLAFLLSYLKPGLKQEKLLRPRHPHWWSHVRLHH